MRLGNHAALLRAQAIKERTTRVAIRTPRRQRHNRLPWRRLGPHEFEETARILALEMEVGQKQMLEQVARNQPLLRTLTVEERLPRRDLLADRRVERDRSFARRALRYPIHERAVLIRIEVRQRERHALVWMLARIIVEFCERRTSRFAVQTDVDIRGQSPRERLRMQLLEPQHAIHDRAIEALVRSSRTLREHWVKAFLAPLRGGQRIDEEPSRIRGTHARAVINDLLAAPALNALVSGKFELTRRVVTAVANHTAALQNRPNLRLLVDRLFGYRIQQIIIDPQRHRQRRRGRRTASDDEQCAACESKPRERKPREAQRWSHGRPARYDEPNVPPHQKRFLGFSGNAVHLSAASEFLEHFDRIRRRDARFELAGNQRQYRILGEVHHPAVRGDTVRFEESSIISISYTLNRSALGLAGAPRKSATRSSCAVSEVTPRPSLVQSRGVGPGVSVPGCRSRGVGPGVSVPGCGSRGAAHGVRRTGGGSRGGKDVAGPVPGCGYRGAGV